MIAPFSFSKALVPDELKVNNTEDKKREAVDKAIQDTIQKLISSNEYGDKRTNQASFFSIRY